ncbi:hypothetical protein HPB51_021382 [Rhipicephalus microplus]|uniref:Ubiquitin-conjugating enzyme E2-18 kDa n=1 Tax=Rhipicephalus microplus TaxID=6941 RepID=A0A9J6F687_RHIMP|nr:hypothetical protein HPB51_021382 [Rhipicephalus microplus]
MAATRRLVKELQDIRTSGTKCFRDIQVDEKNMLTWQGLIVPDNSPYNKGAFRIEINFPAEYPFKPPKITFRTKIYHPNIDEKGQVCLPIISADNWKPATKTDQAFVYYILWQHLVERMLLCMDNSSQYEVSLLSAINMLARAWTRVKKETIANCFRACGFMENSGDASPCAPVEVQTNELDDGSFRAALGDVRFDEYVAVDSNVGTCGPLTDSEIVQMVRPHDCIPENDDDDDDIGNEPPPRAADVAAGLALAQRFFVGEHNAEEALRHVYSLQNLLAAARFGKQKKMTDYFSSKLSRF